MYICVIPYTFSLRQNKATRRYANDTHRYTRQQQTLIHARYFGVQVLDSFCSLDTWYVCSCMYVYIHDVFMYVCMYVCMCLCICIPCAWMYTFLLACAYVCNISMFCLYLSVHTYIHIYIHTYIYIYIYIYMKTTYI
jgi:hypothetical protein